MFFASAYGAIDRLGGAPFFANGGTASTANFLYFSFTSLTTVGYGTSPRAPTSGTPSRSPRR